ncbi:hypothetical protein PT273_06355 [Orbaceae bacterium ESL0727]|nr:hypothetical protein [Orbaceae bacterium ESL0727]
MSSTKVTLKIGLTDNTTKEISFVVPNGKDGKDGIGASLQNYHVTITSNNQASISIQSGLTPVTLFVNGVAQNSDFWSFSNNQIELGTGLVINAIVMFTAYK